VHLLAGDHPYRSLLVLEPNRVVESFVERGLLLDPGATPPHFLALAVLGVVVGLWKVRYRMAAIAVGLVVVTYLYAGRADYYSEALRFSTAPTVFLALAAGFGLAVVCRLSSRAYGDLAGALLAAAAVGGAFASTGPLTAMTADGWEYHLVQSAIDEVHPSCLLVKPPDRMANGRIESNFPVYDFGPRVVITTGHLDEVETPDCVVYYRGLSCVLFERNEPRTDLRPECEEFEEGRLLEPLVTAVFDPNRVSSHRFNLPNAPVDLGFYLLPR
jgi:hypothetical protein